MGVINFKNFITVKVKDLITADWNYKKDDDELKEKLKEQIKRSGFIINIIVRELPNGFYEVVNGNHRVVALRELGIEEVLSYNLGEKGLLEAQQIAIETNETNFESELSELCSIISEIDEGFPREELLLTLPYTEEELERMIETVQRYEFPPVEEPMLDEVDLSSDGESDGLLAIEDVFHRVGLTSLKSENYDFFLDKLKDLKEEEELDTEEDFLQYLMSRGEGND